MSAGILKESKYEILAILREECRVKSVLEVFCEDGPLLAIIKKVDFTTLYINPVDLNLSFNTAGKTFSFVLHSPLGKIEFSATPCFKSYIKNPSDGFDFYLPESINILQRRLTPRVAVKNTYNFFCSGRFKNGEGYKCAINDLSEGGCSFISDAFKKKFMDKGMVLENVEISLAEYGHVVTSLRIISVVPIYHNSALDRSIFRISCKFNYKTLEAKKNIEDIILKITVDRKVKSRR